MQQHKHLLFSFLCCLLAVFLFVPKTFAKDPNSIAVSPSLLQLDLQTDAPQGVLTYTNNTSQPIILTFSSANFSSLEDRVSFLGQNNNQYHYNLASYISFSATTLSLMPRSIGTITVYIQKDKLAPGGHYATILASVQALSPQTSQVQIKSALSSLLFVRTNTGHEIESAKIEEVQPVQNFFDFPTKATVVFNNTGDTHVIPYGLVTIHDMFGRPVAKTIFNDASSIALPQSIRNYDVNITPSTWVLFPQIYTMSTSLHFGKSNQKIASQTTFFSQGNIPLMPLFILIVALLFVVYKRRK